MALYIVSLGPGSSRIAARRLAARTPATAAIDARVVTVSGHLANIHVRKQPRR